MKILLTGATGFLGNTLLPVLLQEGHVVLAHSRKAQPTPTHPHLQWVAGDINTAYFWLDNLREVDAVIHAAALVSFAKHRYNQLLESNVEPTAHLVNGLVHYKNTGHPPIKLIHVSSISAITGERHQTTPLTGLSKTDPDLLTSSYGLSKYLAELEVYRGIEEGINATIINPGFILGRGNWAKGSSSIFSYVASGKPFFTRGTLNYVDVRDVCQGIVNTLALTSNGTRHLLCAGQISYEDFFKQVAHLASCKPPYINIPAGLSHLIARFTEVIGSIIPLSELLSADSLRASQRKSACSGKEASESLGLQYHSLEDTLQWVIADASFPKK